MSNFTKHGSYSSYCRTATNSKDSNPQIASNRIINFTNRTICDLRLMLVNQVTMIMIDGEIPDDNISQVIAFTWSWQWKKKILLRTFFNVKEGNDMKIWNRCHVRFSTKDTYRKWGLDGHGKIQNRSWVSILIVIASSSRTIMLIWLIMIASLIVGNFFFGIRILLFDFCGSHGCSFIHNSSCAVLALLSVSWYRVFLFSDSFIPDQMKDFFPSHAIWSFFCFGFNSPS